MNWNSLDPRPLGHGDAIFDLETDGQVNVFHVDPRGRAMDAAGREIMTAGKVTLRLIALVCYRGPMDSHPSRLRMTTPGPPTARPGRHCGTSSGRGREGSIIMIAIDGSYGEGGGQILRTSLSLSLITGKPFTIEKIRSGRKKPGLMRQHLTAVNAAAEIGNAKVSGNAIGSQAFQFEPRAIRSGRFHYAVGTAGSSTLVLQTILPALIIADGPSEVILEGGTHNPFAPPFDFLDRAFLPLVGRMGPRVVAELEKPGFYPAGGGRFRAAIVPQKALTPLSLMERGPVKRRMACARVSNLPTKIAHRELKVFSKKLGWPRECLRAETVENAHGPGNVLTIEMESNALTEVFTGFGERGVPAEKVAARAAGQALDYLSHNVPVGRYLADQLLVPMAVAGGGRFLSVPPSRHTLTNIDIIKCFMDVSIQATPNDLGQWEIRIS